MTNTDNTTTTVRSAEKLSPPSDRDLEIFQHAQIHGRTHCAIALDFEISRRRVGQIIHDVRHWLSIHGTDDPVIYTQIQRQRLDRALERMHLKDIIQRAIHALNNAPPTLDTTTHVNEHCVKKVKRDQPPVDSRLLKTLLQAVNSLGKLNERQPLPELPAKPWKHPKIQAVVHDWSEKNKEYDFDPEDFDQFAQELTTTIQSCLASSPPTPSGTATPGSGVVCGDDSPFPIDEPPQSTPDPFTSPSPETLNLEPGTLNSASALPSASLPSLPEAPSGKPVANPENAPSPSPTATSNDHSTGQPTATAPETSLQKPEKGSAAPPPVPLSPGPLVSLSPSSTPIMPSTSSGVP